MYYFGQSYKQKQAAAELILWKMNFMFKGWIHQLLNLSHSYQSAAKSSHLSKYDLTHPCHFSLPKEVTKFFLCYPGPHTAIWHLTYLCLNFKSSLSLCLAWCSIQSPLSGGFTSYFLLPQFKKFSHFKIIFTKGTQVSEDFS